MKVRIVEIEGSWEELSDIPVVAEAIRDHQVRTVPTPSPESEVGATSDVPTEVTELIDSDAPQGSRELVRSIAAELGSWEGVDPRRGRSTKEQAGLTRYVRFNRRPQYVGAFAYLVPSRLQLKLRLPAQGSDGTTYASARSVKKQDPYQVVVPIGRDTVEEALTLARRAYELAGHDERRSGKRA